MASDTWLVAHDFSPCGEAAAKEAARVVERLGGKLVLLHVHPLPQLRPEEAWGEETHRMQEELRMRLQGQASVLRERFPKLDIDLDVIPARDPAKGIVEEAERLGVNHVGVGTHGRKGLEHLVLGSVAEKVAREAKVPVTIVRGLT
ncbi:MAG: universal stress protein [Deltaproteobacteria bacterium]|nr:universal stress protein [Deltaproteobacteria bacterium]